jgi:hypothetical protein
MLQEQRRDHTIATLRLHVQNRKRISRQFSNRLLHGLLFPGLSRYCQIFRRLPTVVFTQGAVADVTSTMPTLVSQSTCEAEYCICALATMACHHVKKVYNEFYGHDPDYQLTIPIGIDSQSANATANSFRETQRTKHIARRFNFVRFAENETYCPTLQLREICHWILAYNFVQSRWNRQLCKLIDQATCRGSIDS